MTTIATPSGLTATVVNGNSVKLDWVDNSNNEQGFLIERKTTGDYSLLAVVAANVTTYTDATVVADTGYYYRLRGYLTESNAYIYVDKFGSGLSWLGPEGIHISADGSYLYLSDTLNNRIRKYLRDSPYTVQSGNWPIGGGTGDGSLSSPRGVFDSASFIYVCDSGNDRIQKFTMAGVYEAKIGSYGTGNDQFKAPCGIVASGGNLYITDRDNNRIHKRDNSNSLTYIAKFGTPGSGNGEFNEPYGIDLDTDYLYVCDKNNNRVQIFKITATFGDYVGQFGSLNSSGVAGSITDSGRLQLPTCISVYGNYLYVTDRSNERIQIFQKAPPYTYVGKTGTAGSGNGQFVNVYGIDVNATKIYAVDADNARVTIFNNS